MQMETRCRLWSQVEFMRCGRRAVMMSRAPVAVVGTGQGTGSPWIQLAAAPTVFPVTVEVCKLADVETTPP